MSQFNVYDIFGYMLPGSVVVGVLLFVVWPFADLSNMSSLGGGVAMLLGCYVVGHVLQATVGQTVKGIVVSKYLLSSTPANGADTQKEKISKIFSHLQKANIIELLNSVFNLELPAEPSADEQQKAFDLAYAAIIQHGVAGYVPLYLSLYALYRGLLVSSIVSCVILAANVVYYIGRGFPSTLHAYVMVVLLVLFSCLCVPHPWQTESALTGPRHQSSLRIQFDKYAKEFAVGVYLNFLVWRQAKS